MRSGSKIIVAALALAPLAACGMIDGRDDTARPRLGATVPDRTAQPPATAQAPMPAPAPTPTQRPPESWPAGPLLAAAMRNDDRPVTGDPYAIDGVAWTPADVPSFDEVGYATMLADTADGHHTANGELYVPGAISAAHRTLPMPSYVEVTALDTGRTILVRINDRGPLLNDRVIALSPGAARQLGVAGDSTPAVRVRKVNPVEQERARLRAGGAAGERMETPLGLRTALARRLPKKPAPLAAPAPTLASAPPTDPALKVVPVQHSRGPARPPAIATTPIAQTRAAGPAPVRVAAPVRTPAPAPVPARSGGYAVQLAALSSRAKADALARAVGGYVMPAGSLFRVRTGPYASDAAARGALGSIRAKGYAEARVVVNDAR